jgi:hypothetical protein
MSNFPKLSEALAKKFFKKQKKLEDPDTIDITDTTVDLSGLKKLKGSTKEKDIFKDLPKEMYKDPKKPGAVLAGLAGTGALTADEGKESEPETDIVSDQDQKQTSTPVPKTETDTSDQTKVDPIAPYDVPEAELRQTMNRFEKMTEEMGELKDPPMTSQEQRKLRDQALKDVRDKKININQWSALAEKMIGAVTKYAAAKEGLTDWCSYKVCSS